MWTADSLGKTDPGRDWGQKEKEALEEEMVAWHHLLNGHEFEHNPGDSEGQVTGMLPSMRSQRVWHSLSTEQQQHSC